jgi:hypothetical protein
LEVVVGAVLYSSQSLLTLAQVPSGMRLEFGVAHSPVT